MIQVIEGYLIKKIERENTIFPLSDPTLDEFVALVNVVVLDQF